MDHNTAAVRRFLLEHFDDTELRALCLDYFRDVYLDFTTGMGKRQMVHNLIEHCVNYGRIPDLLAALERERPHLYAQHFTYQPKPGLGPPAQAYAPTQRKPRQVFISHAHQDADFAQRLASDLETHGYAVWIAPDSIRPGEKWSEAIERGLQECSIFVVVLTPDGVASRWMQTETNVAVELEHKGLVRFLPLLVEPSQVPLLWTAYQHISFLASYELGLQQLLRRLSSGDPDLIKDLNIIVHLQTGKEMVRVPAGEFLYGENGEKITLSEYWIDKTPVTNAEYKRFLDANPNYPVPSAKLNWTRPYDWDQKQRTYPSDKADHPVVLVSWHDAKAYADWAGLRLPTEQEWEKAARGTDGREYPWGNELRGDHCNTGETGMWTTIEATTPVGLFSPQGDSPYGCVDMAGNVWEWIDSWYDDSKDSRVLRGGSWKYDLRRPQRVVFRHGYNPDYASDNIGFRLVSPIGSGS